MHFLYQYLINDINHIMLFILCGVCCVIISDEYLFE